MSATILQFPSRAKPKATGFIPSDSEADACTCAEHITEELIAENSRRTADALAALDSEPIAG